MLENMVPNYEGEEASIQFIANSGYALLVNLQNLTPQYMRSTFDPEWLDKYINNRLALIDPVIYWAAWNIGKTRWSEIRVARKMALNDHVLKSAKEFGLNYGVIISSKSARTRFSRNIFSASRSDREFTDEEIDFLESSFNRIMTALGANPDLTSGELEVLHLSARGLNQQEIAITAHISKDAVKKRMEKARRALGASTATQAVATAVSRGMITL